MIIFWLVLSSVVSLILGILANQVAEILRPSLQTRPRLVISSFVGLAVFAIIIIIVLENIDTSAANSPSLKGTEQPESHQIYSVIVQDAQSLQPVANATVTLERGNLPAKIVVSDDLGQALFTADDVTKSPIPNVRLIVEAPGYPRTEREIVVTSWIGPVYILLQPS
jgi:hypothetical protein